MAAVTLIPASPDPKLRTRQLTQQNTTVISLGNENAHAHSFEMLANGDAERLRLSGDTATSNAALQGNHY